MALIKIEKENITEQKNSDKQDYFGFEGTGGGMGAESDGTFSGINNA